VAVAVVVVVRFNEAQKTAPSEKSAFSNSRGYYYFSYMYG